MRHELRWSSHGQLLIASSALLATALGLEGLIAGGHGVPASQIHEHTSVPVMVHAFAIGSLLLSLAPWIRDLWNTRPMTGRFWSVGVIACALGALLSGQTMWTAVGTFIFSLLRFLLQQQAHSRDDRVT